MTQNRLITKKVAAIGEEIGVELGNQFVKAYQESYPADTPYYVIGRDIMDKILSQPGCVGMRIYNAIDENLQKTMVFVGIDVENKPILEYSLVNHVGELSIEKGIVADRIERGHGLPQRTGLDADDWGWEAD